MKNPAPKRPSQISPYAEACLNALARAGFAKYISLGGALGLFHYIEYRATHDADAWWAEGLSETQKRKVTQTLENALSEYGETRVRAWGDVVSVELSREGKTVFSFQVAERSSRLESPVSAGWISIPLDSLADLVASKMTALVERGAPRDFLDIYALCANQLVSVEECWALWKKRQSLSGSDTDETRARLAVETHLERIALHRPIEQIADLNQRRQAQQTRDWYLRVFLRTET